MFNINLKKASIAIMFGLAACKEQDNINVSSFNVNAGWLNTSVNATLVNAGNKDTRVIVYLEQNNRYHCPTTTFMLAREQKRITFSCDSLSDGRVSMIAEPYANAGSQLQGMARTLN